MKNNRQKEAQLFVIGILSKTYNAIYTIYIIFLSYCKKDLYKNSIKKVHSCRAKKRGRNSHTINSLVSARFLHYSALFVQKVLFKQIVREIAVQCRLYKNSTVLSCTLSAIYMCLPYFRTEIQNKTNILEGHICITHSSCVMVFVCIAFKYLNKSFIKVAQLL